MYFLAFSTMAWYSAGVVFDVEATAKGPASNAVADLSSGRSNASTTAESRPVARASAALADRPGSGRTGVTTVIESLTASKTTTSVGRISTASGMPIGSGLGAGNSRSEER